ncbi:MAG: hypothetical protein DRJ68_05465 [Thermoprotei archaeon]|nr:MAG: hypothetical protein DRJ62_00895 [Thermoprotei archaeon]RLF19913.1 MAG: hypothetical protein DRJ68_05465 [Thermoprotei archaeon]
MGSFTRIISFRHLPEEGLYSRQSVHFLAANKVVDSRVEAGAADGGVAGVEVAEDTGAGGAGLGAEEADGADGAETGTGAGGEVGAGVGGATGGGGT